MTSNNKEVVPRQAETSGVLSTIEPTTPSLLSQDMMATTTRSREKVLDEDTYVKMLEHIIKRDFYPDLHKLQRATQQYEALGTPSTTATTAKPPAPKKKATQSHQPAKDPSKPSTFHDPETPQVTHGDDTGAVVSHEDSMDPRINTPGTAQNRHYVDGELMEHEDMERVRGMSLNQFQANFMSEDDRSFNQLLRVDQKDHLSKYPWIVQQQKQSDARKKYIRMLQMGNEDSSLTDKKKQTLAIEAGKSSNTKAIEYKGKSSDANEAEAETAESEDESKEMNEKKLQEFLDNEKEKKHSQKYKGELEFWDFKSVNKLLFFPNANKEAQRKKLLEMRQKHSKPECVFENTRFPKGFKVPVKLDMAAVNSNPNAIKLSENGTPQVRGYSFVKTPHIVPGSSDGNKLGAGTPIVTWGEIADTPIVLDEENRPKGPIFKIPALPKRDRLTHALTKQYTQKQRAKEESARLATTPSNLWHAKSGNRSAMLTPFTPGQSSIIPPSKRRKTTRSLHDLSPAARKLMEERLGRKHTPLFNVHSKKRTPRLGGSSVLTQTKGLSNIRLSSARHGKSTRPTPGTTSSKVLGRNPTPQIVSSSKHSTSHRKEKGRDGLSAIGKKRSRQESNLTDGLL